MTRYVPGVEHLALVGSHTLVVLPRTSTVDVEALWERVSGEGQDVTALLELLAAEGLARTPAFAVVAVSEGELITVVRGSVVVTVVTGAAGVELSAQNVGTWAEQHFTLADVVVVQFGGWDSATDGLPLAAGVVVCDRVAWGPSSGILTAASIVGSSDVFPPPTPRPDPVVEPELSVEDLPGRVAAHEVDREIHSEPIAVEAQKAASEQRLALEVASEADRGSPAAAPTVSPVREPDAPDAEATLTEPQDEFDALWGSTVARRPEDAAVRTAEDDAGLLITAVPSGLAAGSVGGSRDIDAFGDHDGMTVARKDLRPRTGGGPPAGAVQPTHATLAFSTGPVIELERPVLVGRAPKSFSRPSTQVPRLVPVNSPDGFVSGTHVEFFIEDGAVLVRDLSTNGTILTRPGSDPERLARDVPTLVSDGCVVDLGEAITIRVGVDS